MSFNIYVEIADEKVMVGCYLPLRKETPTANLLSFHLELNAALIREIPTENIYSFLNRRPPWRCRSNEKAKKKKYGPNPLSAISVCFGFV